MNPSNNSWGLKGRTERKKDNLNPDFNEKITISYFFEKTQKLRFVMVDCDNEQTMAGDEIGTYECTLG
jgi:Ca2+-dependent lipid-binding protein